jgi:hypothetical protein
MVNLLIMIVFILIGMCIGLLLSKNGINITIKNIIVNDDIATNVNEQKELMSAFVPGSPEHLARLSERKYK